MSKFDHQNERIFALRVIDPQMSLWDISSSRQGDLGKDLGEDLGKGVWARLELREGLHDEAEKSSREKHPRLRYGERSYPLCFTKLHCHQR